MYSKELIQDLLHATDIVSIISSYLPVIKKGKGHVALCPFHDDKNPSLSISKEKQIFKCFVCGAGGDAIGFVSRFEKMSYPEAVRKVAELSSFSDPRLKDDAPRVVIDPNKQRLYSCIDDLQRLYRYALSTDEALKARNYLEHRALGEDMVERFQLGYAPLDGQKTVEYLKAKSHSLKDIQDIGIALAKAEGTSDNNAGRLIIPLYDPKGQLVGFSARQLEKNDTAKYINSPETPIFHKGELLYNYHRISSSARRAGHCYLMEGFMDVMSAYRAGEENAVALMGTSLTQEQITLLKRLRCEIRLCLDGDGPGQKAMMKASRLLSQANIAHRIVNYQGDLRDPDDIYNEDGKEALQNRLLTLLEPMDFYLSFYQEGVENRTQEQRKAILNSFLPYLSSQKAGIEYEEALQKLAKSTGFSPDAIRHYASETNTKAEERENENIVYVKGDRRDHGRLSRLLKAEKTLLYYMLNDPRAIEIYQTRVGSFYDDNYRLAANYIIEYAQAHPNQDIDVSAICSISSSNGENNVTDAITDLAMEKSYEPASETLLKRYATTITEEKNKQIRENKMEQALLEGDDVASKDALNAIIEQKKRMIFKK